MSDETGVQVGNAPDAGTHEKTKTRPWVWVAVTLGAVVVLVGSMLFAVQWMTPDMITVNGQLELDHPRTSQVGCQGQGGYGDIRSGTQVVVTDAAGETLALGSLSSGTPTGRSGVCRYYFKITGVPGDLDFYGVEVARRGRVQYPRARLDAPITVTLG